MRDDTGVCSVRLILIYLVHIPDLNRESGPTYRLTTESACLRVYPLISTYRRCIASCAATERRVVLVQCILVLAPCIYSFKRETSFRRGGPGSTSPPMRSSGTARHSKMRARASKINKVSLRKRQPVPVRARNVSEFQARFFILIIPFPEWE